MKIFIYSDIELAFVEIFIINNLINQYFFDILKKILRNSKKKNKFPKFFLELSVKIKRHITLGSLYPYPYLLSLF